MTQEVDGVGPQHLRAPERIALVAADSILLLTAINTLAIAGLDKVGVHLDPSKLIEGLSNPYVSVPEGIFVLASIALAVKFRHIPEAIVNGIQDIRYRRWENRMAELADQTEKEENQARTRVWTIPPAEEYAPRPVRRVAEYPPVGQEVLDWARDETTPCEASTKTRRYVFAQMGTTNLPDLRDKLAENGRAKIKFRRLMEAVRNAEQET